MATFYYAVSKKKNERAFGTGTRLFRIQPNEDYGGSARDYPVYSYRVQVDPADLSGGPDECQLRVNISGSRIKFVERLLTLGELWELEEKTRQRDEKDRSR